VIHNKADYDRIHCLLSEYQGTGLTPKEIRKIKKEVQDLKEYVDWLESL
jgi:hypothetical protein